MPDSFPGGTDDRYATFLKLHYNQAGPRKP